jgi:hypothetical protein
MIYYYVHDLGTPFLLKKELNIVFQVYRRMRFHLVRQHLRLFNTTTAYFHKVDADANLLL